MTTKHRPRALVYCPACGTKTVTDLIALWTVRSEDDQSNFGQVWEYRCTDCSLSFWV